GNALWVSRRTGGGVVRDPQSVIVRKSDLFGFPLEAFTTDLTAVHRPLCISCAPLALNPPEKLPVRSRLPMSGKLVRKKQRNFEDGTRYDGGWERGLFHGQGTLTWANGCVYEGGFRRGERHGTGICTFPGGERYAGAWDKGKMHGEGTLEIKGRTLTGVWNQGVPDFNPPVDGYKRFVFPDGKGVYDGHWREYKRHGQGLFAFSNGDVYEGQWSHGEMTGEGKYQHASGEMYKGQFKNGRMHGQGTYSWPSTRQCYTGKWKEGLRHGHGRHYFHSSSAGDDCDLETATGGDYYDGEWKEGVMHGEGVYVDAGGERHAGLWVDGICPEVDFAHVPEGSGSFRYSFSGGTYEGEWLNRTPHGQGRMEYSDGTVYVGGWQDFKFHGFGKLVQRGVVFEGE
ncbi:unnamed protein product, partial [Ectocarpus sp. 8 AP-2014]